MHGALRLLVLESINPASYLRQKVTSGILGLKCPFYTRILKGFPGNDILRPNWKPRPTPKLRHSNVASHVRCGGGGTAARLGRGVHEVVHGLVHRTHRRQASTGVPRYDRRTPAQMHHHADVAMHTEHVLIDGFDGLKV